MLSTDANANQVQFRLDGADVSAPKGETVLETARRLKKDIPTLCQQEGLEPLTSCFLCVVRVAGKESLQPACAFPVEEGIEVTTVSEEIDRARRTAVELLLSDHAGRCVAPCAMACPAQLDIPRFLSLLRTGKEAEAARLARRQLVLPAVLSRVCRGYCQNPCLRGKVDSPIGIRELHSLAVESVSASPANAVPSDGPTVAVVGAGPAGIAAAHELAALGLGCVLYEQSAQPGGLLRQLPTDILSSQLLEEEIVSALRSGILFRPNLCLGRDFSLDELLCDHAGVILAIGAAEGSPDKARRVAPGLAQGLAVTARGLAVGHGCETARRGVFAAGEATLGAATAVRSIGAGRAAAVATHQFLNGEAVTGLPLPWNFVARTGDDELSALTKQNAAAQPSTPPDSSQQGEAWRCLQCGCAGYDKCRLRLYGARFGVHGKTFAGRRRALEPDDSHPEILYDPGKCILCGLCIEIALREGEPWGLCFVGRGFPTRVSVPLARSLVVGLGRAARACARACPTGAMVERED